MQPVRYQGRVVALATRRGIFWSDRLEALEPDHPRRRFVREMCEFWRQVQLGLPLPYTDDNAQLFARTRLMPDELFDLLDDRDDVELAELFNVPLEEVAPGRRDVDR